MPNFTIISLNGAGGSIPDGAKVTCGDALKGIYEVEASFYAVSDEQNQILVYKLTRDSKSSYVPAMYVVQQE